MKKTIIIHGTGGHSQENWFPWLKCKLEKQGLKVFTPDLPGSDAPNLDEWSKEFDKYIEHIDDKTILVGHSLGGTFLLKFLEKFEGKVGPLFLVASPIGIRPIKYYEGDIAFVGNFDFNWEKLKNISDSIFVYHSDNDEFVSLDNGKALSRKLGADLNIISNAGHFNKAAGYTKFKRLLEDIEQGL